MNTTRNKAKYRGEPKRAARLSLSATYSITRPPRRALRRGCHLRFTAPSSPLFPLALPARLSSPRAYPHLTASSSPPGASRAAACCAESQRAPNRWPQLGEALWRQAGRARRPRYVVHFWCTEQSPHIAQSSHRRAQRTLIFASALSSSAVAVPLERCPRLVRRTRLQLIL